MSALIPVHSFIKITKCVCHFMGVVFGPCLSGVRTGDSLMMKAAKAHDTGTGCPRERSSTKCLQDSIAPRVSAWNGQLEESEAACSQQQHCSARRYTPDRAVLPEHSQQQSCPIANGQLEK